MTFDDILPFLASAYRRGVLVPFIGSGMSIPACTGWLDFLTQLADAAGVPVPDHLRKGDAGDKSELYRLADSAVLGLGALGATERADAYRRALNRGGKRAGECTVPEQTRALARRNWPLVVTTNYDDLYAVSRMGGSDETDIPEVLGRSVEDCHKVVRALDAPTRPILWAVQGFLGGQAATPETLVPHSRRLLELAGQVVVGHQQYQNAINAHAHFRRAFAEVFHRRSLLFLGSGLLEDYLVNLFGEIAHHYGPGPHPHFALVPEEKRTALDPRFLQMRLGIIPVFYADHRELPGLLDRLAESVSGPGNAPRASAAQPVGWLPDELGFSLTNGAKPPFSPSRKRLRLRYATLEVPARDSDECVILSLGREPDNQPIHGSQASTFLDEAHKAGLIADTEIHRWRALDASPSYAYRFDGSPIFGVAARVKNPVGAPAPGEPKDRRNLSIIDEAVYMALGKASDAGFRRVHLGPVAAGQFRLWNPIHPFVQTLVGIRRFFTGHPGTPIEQLDLHVFTPAVWFPVVSGKVPVGEILSTDVMKVWVDVRTPEGASEIFAITAQGPMTVRELKKLCGLAADRWSTEILPRPSKEPASTEDDLLVAPTAIVVFSPRT
ncbi:MAG TPA: SIR2 family protein [Archangium sp.]|nr:SIR2 family protein [Archangium sp.]